MKKIIRILGITLVFLTFGSCKKEISEPEAIKEINSLVSKKNVSKESFEKDILPVVNDLFEADSVKFRMINHIALKAKKETNKAVFQLQMQNLKDEMKFVK